MTNIRRDILRNVKAGEIFWVKPEGWDAPQWPGEAVPDQLQPEEASAIKLAPYAIFAVKPPSVETVDDPSLLDLDVVVLSNGEAA